MTPESFISEESFDTALDFLDALRCRDRRWLPTPSDWIFRGHAASTWQLNPMALRPGTLLEFKRGGMMAPCADHETQIWAEFGALRAFLAAADEQGLPLPPGADAVWGDDRLYRKLWDAIDSHRAYFEGRSETWPPRELQPLFALAQHHGVPTRLLDWTRRPLVAAYFAAEPAAREKELQRDRLAVWGFRYAKVQGWGFWNQGPESIEIVRALGSHNPNLHAQRALFTLVRVTAVRPSEPVKLAPLDTLILNKLRSQREEWLATHKSDAPVLRKLTLPVSEAPRLLRLLAEEDVTGQMLFRGFDGAVRGLRERMFWDSAD
jgi:hypothetical protein